MAPPQNPMPGCIGVEEPTWHTLPRAAQLLSPFCQLLPVAVPLWWGMVTVVGMEGTAVPGLWIPSMMGCVMGHPGVPGCVKVTEQFCWRPRVVLAVSSVFFSHPEGILYINSADLGWNPPVSSWIDKREIQSERANLTILFDKYLPPCLDTLRTRYHLQRLFPQGQKDMHSPHTGCAVLWRHGSRGEKFPPSP